MLTAFKHIRCFVFDVDGVLTNGQIILLPGGVMARTMNTKDGYALQLAIKKGYEILIISGAKSEEVMDRLSKLGITQVIMGCNDKATAFSHWLHSHPFQVQEILAMGDDIPDGNLMKMAGIPSCPADAVMEIQQIAKYQSPLNGGKGAVRDVIEKVLKLRGDWSEDTTITSI